MSEIYIQAREETIKVLEEVKLNTEEYYEVIERVCKEALKERVKKLNESKTPAVPKGYTLMKCQRCKKNDVLVKNNAPYFGILCRDCMGGNYTFTTKA